MKQRLVFFDAECLVCNRAGHFLLAASTDLFLAPIGGITWQGLKLPPSVQGIDSIVYWDGEKASVRSEALRGIGSHLGGIWKALAWLSRLIPTALLDFGYDRFARLRYRLFGRVASCSLIPPAYTKRLLP